MENHETHERDELEFQIAASPGSFFRTARRGFLCVRANCRFNKRTTDDTDGTEKGMSRELVHSDLIPPS
jgi:hypothetical protein